jgi:SAM-dependent methyltransferase
MFDASAEFYDTIYGTFKDYTAEAAKIANLLRAIDPKYKTVLDVGCGTGEHARRLTQAGFIVDGVDINADFVRIAQRKNQAGRFVEADMSKFELPHRYDVVMCLFSSIGYLRTLDRVASALRRFRDHLRPGGAVIVEPWFEPSVLDPQRGIDQTIGEANGVRVTRSSRIEVEPSLSRLHFDYEITDATGTRHVHEVHELGLFTNAELMDAFRGSGFAVTYDSVGLINRGLYIGRPIERSLDSA